MLSWSKNSRNLRYQYSKSNKLKTVTSQQDINIAKVESISISTKFGNHPKNQVSALHPRSRKSIKFKKCLNYPAFALQLRPRRSEKSEKGIKNQVFALQLGTRRSKKFEKSIKNQVLALHSRLRLTSGKGTTNYCSALENSRLLTWGKNPGYSGHQHSKSDKLKTTTPRLNDKWSRKSVDIIKGKHNTNFRAKSNKFKVTTCLLYTSPSPRDS